ncbi:D-lactate dehydrogenase [Flavobacterium sp. CG_9.10]|uniref:NAD(P)-dependent oxidoreductase n=1 Tax=Flavobacterium sp. CG_9.10 TaxID=2787729 RepID=UPI0018CB43E7|nr:NAD(P)-dependent oxidoreductase [Flavobacterium sp. CG_9.10]MBG6109614.1 D-lactate dehydrogenase [Flavobacterium sp. CG_9.10]
MKTLIYSISGFDKPFIEKATHGNLDLVYTDLSLNETTVKLAKGFDAISIFTSDEASAIVLERLHALGVKYIALRSESSDYINISKAHALGIKVANTPISASFAVAEHAVALLLALNRKLMLGQKLMQLGDYRIDHLIGFNLQEKTMGIIGTGKTGSAFAKIMHGFGCKILAYDPVKDEELKLQANISYTTFNDLCSNSDVISIHCPLNSKTNHLFNKSTFAKMRKEAILINTAHGSIVNTVDLLHALNDGIIAGVGLDVYEHEKSIFFKDHTGSAINDDLLLKLSSHPNVLLTGHQGFLTAEVLNGIASTTIANLNEWAYNSICKNEIK